MARDNGFSASAGQTAGSPAFRRTRTPAASSMRSVWSRLGFGSTTTVRPAFRIQAREEERTT
jgi:hypothetical protein